MFFGVLNPNLAFPNKISWRNIEKNVKIRKNCIFQRFYAYNSETINLSQIASQYKIEVDKISYRFHYLCFAVRQGVPAQALIENWRILAVSAKIHFFHSRIIHY